MDSIKIGFQSEIVNSVKPQKTEWTFRVGSGTWGKLQRDTCVCVKSLQSCLALCDPMDSNLPGSSVHGILQARILEWVAISSSRGSSQPRDQTCTFWISCHRQEDSLPSYHLESWWRGINPLSFHQNSYRSLQLLFY